MQNYVKEILFLILSKHILSIVIKASGFTKMQYDDIHIQIFILFMTEFIVNMVSMICI